VVEIPNLPPGVDPWMYLSPEAFGKNFFHFQARIDQRPMSHPNDSPTVTLVPRGAHKPKVFQSSTPFTNVTYNRSVPSFYQAPK
jgi:hypothetical protein